MLKGKEEIMSLTWNFSSSEVTSPWALARGVWHLSIHWCTWDMESVERSQHCALQLNMRPCGNNTQLRHVMDVHGCRDQTGKQVGGKQSTACTPHASTDKTHTCILRMCSLSRLWTMSSTTVCMRAWCASAISVRPAHSATSSLKFTTSLASKPDLRRVSAKLSPSVCT